MYKRYLIATDFDGTAFHTFTKSPHGIGVNEAYQLSLDDIFGEGIGKWFFENIGLDNRTPLQTIVDLFDKLSEHKQHLILNAFKFLEKQQGSFGNLIPESNEGTLNWNHNSPETTVTQMLVIQKLRYLMKEIGERDGEGKIWPQPCQGFPEFNKTIAELKRQNVPIDTAVISSGHESFIRKVFEIWGITQPDILVTDDDIRTRLYPSDLAARFKPGAFPLALTHHKWLKLQNLDCQSFFKEAQDSKKRMYYIGDDPRKDGLMAKNGKITGDIFPQKTWEDISFALKENARLLDGRAIEGIMNIKANRIEFNTCRNPERKY